MYTIFNIIYINIYLKSHLTFRSGKFNVHITVFNIIGDKNSNNYFVYGKRLSTKYNMHLLIDQSHKINGGGKDPIVFVVIRPTNLVT